MRFVPPGRSPLLPALLPLLLIGASAWAASPPVPGKKGPQAPHYERGAGGISTTPPPIFRPRPGSAPVQGAQTYTVLAVRASFSDTPIDSSTAYYDRMLLFLRQYWDQVSDGQVTLNTTLWDSVFTLPQTMAYYGDDDRFQERLVYMVRDLVALADSTIDFTQYQSLYIFHAGAGQEADVFDDSRQQIWSAFVTPEDFAMVLPDSTGAVGIKTKDQVTPGVFYRVKEAVEAPELESQDGFEFGLAGVVFHEFGHQLGRLRGQPSMPDLYDTNGSEGGTNQGIGSWDIMGGGVWNANGFVPAGLSAWTRFWMGFVAPVQVNASGPQTLSMLERQAGAAPRILQIPITQSEYFLIENRRHDLDGNGRFTFDDTDGDGCFDFYTDSYAGAEFDFFLPAILGPPDVGSCGAETYASGSGVLIYHVDDSKIEAGLPFNTVQGDASRKGIDVVEADGIEDLDGPPSVYAGGSPYDVFRAGYKDRFTPDTSPSTAAYGNVRTGISVTDISAPDSVMTMNVTIDRTRAGWPKLLTGRIRTSPSVAADLNGDGSLELIVPVQRLNNTGAVYAFRADGMDFLDGDAIPTPFAVTTSAPTSSPCVGDIDGVPGVEVVFQTLNGAIYAYHANATEVMDGDADPLTTGILVQPLAVPTGTRAQPILVDLDGDGALDIVTGQTATVLGGSTLRVVRLSGGFRTVYNLPMAGSTEDPPAAADLDGDGLPEVIISNVITVGEDNALDGLSIANWDILSDGTLPTAPENFAFYMVAQNGPYSAPVMADVDRDGRFEVLVADRTGAYHAFRFSFTPRPVGEPPNLYVQASEIPGWPVPSTAAGRISEVSLGDLERDGYPEVLHTGDDVRVTALHYNGAPRSGYPVKAAAAYAPSDSAGFWPPLVADVDGDGVRDVIAILPDGRRPAFRGDGTAMTSFVELGSTGANAPPMLLDLDNDGTAEWVETYDSSPTQATVTTRTTQIPVSASNIAWGQYRNAATRNAVLATAPAGPAGGTQNLSGVYAYPNPSRTGVTTIHYRLAEAATSVSVRILDPTGATVADLPLGAGSLAGSAEHAVPWDNRSVASGVYLCRVEVRSSRGTEVLFANLAVVR